MKKIAPKTLEKIAKRWPHLIPACSASGIGEEQRHRAIASAVLRCEVSYLSPLEVLRLSEVLA